MIDNYIIYTDGGCRGNPGGKGAYAAIIFKGTTPLFISAFEDDTTNQRMELKAAILGLKFIERPSNLKLYSDSAYLCNCFNNKWYENWNKNNWKNSKGEPVANKDLWVALLQLMNFHTSVEYIKVPGHADNIFNNKCDEMVNDILDFKEDMDKNLDKN